MLVDRVGEDAARALASSCGKGNHSMTPAKRTVLHVILLVLIIGVMLASAASLPVVRCQACDGDGSNEVWGHKDYVECRDCKGWGRRALWYWFVGQGR